MTLKLPFFALSRRTTQGSVPAESPNASGFALAFTTLIDAESYLQAVHFPDFELELVVRQSLAKYLDTLEQEGLLGVGFDAKPGGETTFTLAELREMFAL